MVYDSLTNPAGAGSPDADRAGLDARVPQWVVHLIALVIRFMLARLGGARLPSWWHERPDLPLASVQAEAASVRGPFGNAIAWMCLRRGIGPGHPDWPELSRAIVAFGGSVKGFRAGARPYGLQWWENPNIMTGMAGETAAAPAAAAMAVLRSRQAAEAAPSPAPRTVVRPDAEPARPIAVPRRVVACTATGPPTGPPAVWAQQFCYAGTNGARAWPAPPY